MATEKPDKPTVFLVEDDPAVREYLTMVLELFELCVESFASSDEFLAQYDPSRRGCLVLDVHLPGTSGVQLYQMLVRNEIHIPTIFLTGHAPPDVSDESRWRGVVAVFEKPCPPDKLIDAILAAFEEA